MVLGVVGCAAGLVRADLAQAVVRGPSCLFWSEPRVVAQDLFPPCQHASQHFLVLARRDHCPGL
eukprot:6735344-Alexandrium_andersonii.AAC.1